MTKASGFGNSGNIQQSRTELMKAIYENQSILDE